MTDSISRTSRLRLLLVLLVSLVGCDQASKQYAVTHWAHLETQPPQSYFYDTFRITFAYNEGAFLGLLDKQPPNVRYAILVIGNGLLLMALVIGIHIIPMDRWSYLAWALVFAGGIGNLIDRIRINAVIDFLNLGIGPVVRTGIFNVADMAITAGFLMLVPQIFRGEPKEVPAPATTPGTPS